MPIVLRVEDAKGNGPYQARLYEKWDSYRGQDPAHRPMLAIEWSKMREGHFGFTTREQLNKWFNFSHERRTLRKLGFHAHAYDVPDDAIIAADSKQVCFNRSKAVLRPVRIKL